MNLNELQSVQARERQSDSLQELRPTFYQDVAEFIAELRDERARVAADADDPFEDPSVTQLTDDIQTAEQTVDAIYERRVGKVVKMASLAAADMPSAEEGLTTEEQDLYDTLVEAIETHRDDVLASLTEGELSPAASNVDRPQSEAAAAVTPDEGVDAAGVMGADAESDSGSESVGPGVAEASKSADDGTAPEPDGGPPAESEADQPESSPGPVGDDSDADRTTVRITRDVGAILGVDEREYDLATDDVVTLPAENAEPLIERDAAEPLE